MNIPSGMLEMRGMVRQVEQGLDWRSPTSDRGMIRHSDSLRGTALSNEDKGSQLYTLLSSGQVEQPVQPAYTEAGVLMLVPVVIWCLMSWALSYAGSREILMKMELFAFVPAAAAAFSCERIRQLRALPAQLTSLKEENEWFKSSNAELKQGVDLLKAENEEARATNQKLQTSIAGLESVRSAIETYASRHETDFGHVLAEFQKNVAEQQSILARTRQIQRRTRRLAEAQWRALMLNLYAQVERYQEGKRGMNRKGYEMWLAMLPTEISDRLSPETFESIDVNGDDIIEVQEMCAWVQNAVRTLLRVEQGESDGSEESEEPPTVDSSAGGFASLFGGAFRAGTPTGTSRPGTPLGTQGLGQRRASLDRKELGAANRAASLQAAGSSRAASSREAQSREEEEETSNTFLPSAGSRQPATPTRKASPRLCGINFAGNGDLKLFSTHPPAMAGSPGAASGSSMSPPPAAGSMPPGPASGAPVAERRSSRNCSLPPGRPPAAGRPSFNQGYMQMLYGSAPQSGRGGAESQPPLSRARDSSSAGPSRMSRRNSTDGLP